MKWNYYLKYLWYKILYIIFAVIYLMQLNILNKKLLFYDFKSSFELLAYDQYKPIVYFVLALCMSAIGVILIIREFIRWKRTDIFSEEVDITDIIISVVFIVVTIIIIILIIKFISIPILRAILAALCVASGIIIAQTN